MDKDTKEVDRKEAQLTGRTEGPFGSDDTDVDLPTEDNKNRYEQENSANGLDSEQVRGGQDGRNVRAIGSTDMDGKNGVLRMGDQDNSTMEVTEEALKSVGSADKTSTASLGVTTQAPDRRDDDAAENETRVPNAQTESGRQPQKDDESTADNSSQEEVDHDIAQTGTDLTNKPTY